MKKRRRPTKFLTPKRKRLLKYVAQGVPAGHAAKLAGYSPRNPDQSAHNALKIIGEKMPQVIERLGYTDDKIILQYLAPLLKANKTEYFAYQGSVTDQRNVTAHDIRLRALDTLLKLKGSYAPTQIEQNVQHTLTTVEIDDAITIARDIAAITVIDIDTPADDATTELLPQGNSDDNDKM